MARIRIEDLPITETFTPEEEQILGAGRSFRPTVEALESREMYAVNLGTALTPSLLPTANPAQGQALMRTLPPTDQLQGHGGAAQIPLHGNLLANQNQPLMKQVLGQQKVGG